MRHKLATTLTAAACLIIAAPLFGVTNGQPDGNRHPYVGVAILLPLVAVVASALPARRAMRIDPAGAMRAE